MSRESNPTTKALLVGQAREDEPEGFADFWEAGGWRLALRAWGPGVLRAAHAETWARAQEAGVGAPGRGRRQESPRPAQGERTQAPGPELPGQLSLWGGESA